METNNQTLPVRAQALLLSATILHSVAKPTLKSSSSLNSCPGRVKLIVYVNLRAYSLGFK